MRKHPFIPSLRTSIAALSLAAAAAPVVKADPSDDIRQLRAEVQVLEQKLAELEQKQAAAQAAPAPQPTVTVAQPAVPAPKITLDDTGFRFTSAAGDTGLHIGGLLQFDSRLFFGDGGGVYNNSFILRRARPIVDGTIDSIYSFQFVTDFGGTGTPSIYDANIGINLSPEAQIKVGKFKAPIGLEQLQSDAYTFFVERSLATNLVPNRDLGVQLGGAFGKGIVSYAAGVFNGVPDAANTTNQDFDNDKDLEGRVFLQPFTNAASSPVKGLGFGISAGDGREKGTSAVTAGYKTDGQQTFFKYNAAVVANGDTWRVSPQAYDYTGPFGLLAEYVVSTVNVSPTATGKLTQLENKAWDVQAGWVLTGENATFNGVVPQNPFSVANHTWGAWQVVARYADLKIDPNAFPLFASPTTNADQAAAWGGGLNWYLSRVTRISFDYFDTKFSNLVPTSATQILRQDERAFITRIQLYF